MVDFQERDTRRSLGDDGGTDDAEDSGAADQPQERIPVGASEDASGADRDRQEQDERDHEHDGHDHEHDGHDHEQHDHHAHDRESVSAAILTVSTSRSIEQDDSGDAIVDVLEAEGHEVATRELVNDSYDGVQSAVDALVSREDVEVLVTTGGTGVSPTDVTPGAVRPLFEKDLPGFGEVFRALSYEEIGTRTIATRAVAGIADGVPVFCLPGSEDAARLGTTEVIVPELGHLVGLARPHEAEE